jgi:hypothetical protein
MQIVDNKQSLLSFVSDLLVDFWLVYPASGRACKESSVVDSAHVITSASKRKWDPQNQNCGIDPGRMVPT